MNKKILIGCYEVPGYGGANTASYKLFQLLQDTGLEIFYVNLISEYDNDYFKLLYGKRMGNPKELKNVFNCVLKNPVYRSHEGLSELIEKIDPDIMIGVGVPSSYLIKLSSPRKPLIFMTSGCSQAKQYISDGRSSDALSILDKLSKSVFRPEIIHQLEKKVVEKADLILTHSYLIKELMEHFYPGHVSKIYQDIIWFAEWIYKDAIDYIELAKPYNSREIELLFIASAWNRPEKNYPLLKNILRKLGDMNVHVVGEVDEKCKNVNYHGLIVEREKLFELLGNSKTLVSPSSFDPAPGILYEASAFGCNIVASKNCGNWQICNDNLLVDPYSLENYIMKISLAVKKKFDDNIEYFLNNKSLDYIVDIISVFN